MERVRVLLVRKLAEVIDGVDLTQRTVGQTFEVPARDGQLLVAEGWAVPATRANQPEMVSYVPSFSREGES